MTAAAAHVGNVSSVRVARLPNILVPQPSEEMRAQEDFTIDYFPLRGTPPALVGRFAWAVVRALEERVISLDTAATLLATTQDKLDGEMVERIRELTGPR